jgi:GMP synthase (glutamine-hydrolysing)
MPTAAVIRHVPFENLDTLGALLERRGYQITCHDSGYDDLDRAVIGSSDLVVILGGPIGVYQAQAYPALRDEIAIAEARMRADRPLLGVCLGSQVMAAALGVRVYPGVAGKEIGWKPLVLTKAGAGSPLEAIGPAHTAVLHWHGDTFDLPRDASLLASTDQYPHQAFSYGRNALALQFHAEVTARSLERWFIGHTVEIGGVDGLTVEQLRGQTVQHATTLVPCAERFFSKWLESIEVSGTS